MRRIYRLQSCRADSPHLNILKQFFEQISRTATTRSRLFAAILCRRHSDKPLHTNAIPKTLDEGALALRFSTLHTELDARVSKHLYKVDRGVPADPKPHT